MLPSYTTLARVGYPHLRRMLTVWGLAYLHPIAFSGAPGKAISAATYVASVLIVNVGLNPDDVGNSDPSAAYRLPTS